MIDTTKLLDEIKTKIRAVDASTSSQEVKEILAMSLDLDILEKASVLDILVKRTRFNYWDLRAQRKQLEKKREVEKGGEE